MTTRIAVLTLGGTITSIADPEAGGIVPSLNADDLVRSVPGLPEEMAAKGWDIHAETVALLPSPSLRFADLVATHQRIQELVRSRGITGVVVVQGTDTLEESCWFLHLLHQGPVPVVLTGAMRSPQQAGADGSANLLAAVQVAAHPDSHGRGVMLAWGDSVYAPLVARKGHTTSASAFISEVSGPLASLVEGQIHWWTAPLMTIVQRIALDWPELEASWNREISGEGLSACSVPVLPLALGMGPELIDMCVGAAEQGTIAGVVIAGLGSGHAPQDCVPALTRLSDRVPVVLASRIGVGSTTRAMYGYPGSEIDLHQRGLLPAGWLSPWQARLTLQVALQRGWPQAELAGLFRIVGQPG